MRYIDYKVSKEDAISRIPGLFAYIDIDDENVHKATDSVMGCFEKYVDNIKCLVTNEETQETLFGFCEPYIVVENDEEKHFVFFEKDTTYSYRTLITYYYRYKNQTSDLKHL